MLATQPGFMIVKDYKWNDSANLAAMHLLGLVQDRGLRSVRDLRGAHVPLLRAVRAAGLGVLKDQFGIDTAQVRAYFHYLPTFYHLHVHFDHVSADVTATHAVSKAILLDDVIGESSQPGWTVPLPHPPSPPPRCLFACSLAVENASRPVVAKRLIPSFLPSSLPFRGTRQPRAGPRILRQGQHHLHRGIGAGCQDSGTALGVTLVEHGTPI